VERGTPGSERDFDRSLTEEGEEKLRRIAKSMRRLELSFDLVLTSPYVRARQTAEVVAEELELSKSPELCDPLRADRSNSRDIVEVLLRQRPLPGRVLLVGHEPNLSSLVSFLTSGMDKTFLSFKKAGLCKMTTDSVRPGRCAHLDWLLTPRQMLLMS
jgi:phosphohistidine phosphatase